MTNRDTLLQLRDRLRAATGPDRELDLAIQNSLGGERSRRWMWLDDGKDVIVRHDYGPCAPGNPVCGLDAYTASIDAAVTLVPEGLWYLCCTGRVREDEPLYAASFNLPDMTEDALSEVAAAEHAVNMPLCFCLARVEYELAKVNPT